jgi:Mrp family chromosome partitioning ATPase
MLVTATRNKTAAGLAVAGIVCGLGFALLKELLFNRNISRASEIQKFTGIEALLAIPLVSKREQARVPATNGHSHSPAVKNAGRKNIAPWDSEHFVRRYCEAIRDRIGLYFELHQLTHKPKLVGVTSFSGNAGTSTLAAGLAAALSETGDGKVLLVDVNLGPHEVHPFFRGRPAYPLTTALQPSGAIDSAAENLYLATVGSPNAGPAQLGLKKFFDLMPNLKASDFDYVIFDMPPLGQTSPTLGMAGFMDRLLLVVDAGKNNRDMVRRGYAALASTRDNIAVVLNKTQSHAPKWVDGEF